MNVFYDNFDKYLSTTFVNSCCEVSATKYDGEVVKASIDPDEYRKHLDTSYSGDEEIRCTMEYMEGGLHLTNETELSGVFEIYTFTQVAKTISNLLYTANSN